MRAARVYYPALFMAFPVLGVAAQSAGDYQLADALSLAAAMAALGTVAVALARLALRQRTPETAAALVMIGVLAFWGYAPLQDVLGRHVSWTLSRNRFLIPGLVLGVALAGRTLLRRSPPLEALTRFLAITGVLVVSVAAFRVFANESRASRWVESSALARELARPVAQRDVTPNLPARPDIFVVVLDGYAHGAVLRDRYDFDNSSFEDSLRALGFEVPTDVRSNYSQTILSLPSFLNFSQITALTNELGSTSRDRSLPRYLIRHNRAARFLKDQGYRFVYFPSGWWAPTRGSELADEQFRAWRGVSISREMNASALRRSIVDISLLRFLLEREPRYDAEHVSRTLDGVAELATRPEATFALAHLLIPHRPYIVDAACGKLSKPVPHSVPFGTPRDKGAYIEQLRCTNRLVLDAVSEILARSPTPPVVILQGDHGTLTLQPFTHPDRTPTPEQLRERHGAFGAYHLPYGGADAMPDSVTLVNVLRVVLAHYFAADLRPLPDDVYFSQEREPYRFFPVSQSYQVGAPLAPAATRVGQAARRGDAP